MFKVKLIGNSKRNADIDFLRGIAVLLVLVAHFPIVQAISSGAWIGVDLFFVISGYLISSLLLTELNTRGSVDVKRFLIRRGFKIYPVFYLYLAFVVFYYWITKREISGWNLVGELFFAQNYLGNFFEHTWSLAVEEHFYLLISLLILLIGKLRKPQYLLYVSAFVIVSALMFRLMNASASDWGPFTHHYRTHLRIDSMFVGAIGGYINVYHRAVLENLGRNFLLTLLALVIISTPFFVPIENFYMNVFGLIFLAFAFLQFLMFFITKSNPSTPRVNIPLVSFIGKHSYAIYLWHIPVRNIIFLFSGALGLEMFSVPVLVVYLAGTVIFGTLVSMTIEAWCLNFRDRHFQTRADAERIFANSS